MVYTLHNLFGFVQAPNMEDIYVVTSTYFKTEISFRTRGQGWELHFFIIPKKPFSNVLSAIIQGSESVELLTNFWQNLNQAFIIQPRFYFN